jgi:hypothetical protein
VRSELRLVKGRENLSLYGAHLQDILLLFMFIITEYPFKKNGTKVTEELQIVVWRPEYFNYRAAKSPGLGLLPSSILFRQTSICMSAEVSS